MEKTWFATLWLLGQFHFRAAILEKPMVEKLTTIMRSLPRVAGLADKDVPSIVSAMEVGMEILERHDRLRPTLERPLDVVIADQNIKELVTCLRRSLLKGKALRENMSGSMEKHDELAKTFENVNFKHDDAEQFVNEVCAALEKSAKGALEEKQAQLQQMTGGKVEGKAWMEAVEPKASFKTTLAMLRRKSSWMSSLLISWMALRLCSRLDAPLPQRKPQRP